MILAWASPFKWHCNTLKPVQSIDEIDDVQMTMWRWGDRAWWVIESGFLHSPDKGFWACLEDLPPDGRETWVQLYKTQLRYPRVW